jgi:hypothetical protein
METMKNTERTGVDIRVALSSNAKAILTRPSGKKGSSAAYSQTVRTPTFRIGIKRWMKRCAKLLYKVIRPFGRPLAFRSRAYLIAPLAGEIHEIRKQIAKDLAAHQRLQLEVTERLLTSHTASLMREIRTSRETLRSRLATRGTNALIQKLLQPAGTFAEFGAHAEVNGPIDVLKIDAALFAPDMFSEISLIASNNSHIALIVEFSGPGLNTQSPVHDWPRAFEHLGLIAKAINSESGALQDVLMHKAEDEVPCSLFFAREGAKAWRNARGGKR